MTRYAEEILKLLKKGQLPKEVFLLCDSSKLENDSYFTYSSLSLINKLITDKKADNEIVKSYKNNNINIITI